MKSWKENIGKYIVVREQEIEEDCFLCYVMSKNVSFGVFKILPYKEELFPDVNYKVVLDPIDTTKYHSVSRYIMDLNNPTPKIFDNIEDAEKYACELNSNND